MSEPTSADTEEQELDLGIVATGNADVDESLNGLSDLAERPVAQHPEVFQGVHDKLSQALSQFDADAEVEPDTESNH